MSIVSDKLSAHCQVCSLHWTQMADGFFRLVSNGQWPFESVSEGLRGHIRPVTSAQKSTLVSNGQQILKFEFDNHLIFYNLMLDSQFHLQLRA